jgi:hypothetical protein
MNANNASELRGIVQGSVLLLSSCPDCRGAPSFDCPRCRLDLAALGAAAFCLLSDLRMIPVKE